MSEFERTYASFEERFRGGRETVVERLRSYAPFLADLERRLPVPLRAVDCGCGRGEWLQLLVERGWEPLGVDLNASMLHEATSLGLRVEQGDLVQYLGTFGEDSVALVTAFHVVEHMSQDALFHLVRESLRVLVPGGLLILETPNPENLTVGTWSFYQDPTHTRPIPAPLLQFLVDQAGFGASHVVRLNGELDLPEAAGLEQAIRPMFTRALDFSIVATKSSDPERLTALTACVQDATQRPPIDLGALRAISNELGAIGPAIHGLEKRVRALAESHQRSLSSLHHAAAVEHERLGKLEADLTAVSSAVSAAHRTILLMQSSRSWRITAPLRAAGTAARRFRDALVRARISMPSRIDRHEPSAAHVLPAVSNWPRLGRLVGWVLTRWPGGHNLMPARLRALGLQPKPMQAGHGDQIIDGAPVTVDEILRRLPPRSRTLYVALQEDLTSEQADKRTHAPAD